MIGRGNIQNPQQTQPQQPQLGGMRRPVSSGLSGSLAGRQAASRPLTPQTVVRPQMSMNMSGRQDYANAMSRRYRPAFGEGNHDAMTGVSARQRTGMPNAVEAARQQGSGLGGSLPQPKQYSNAPNVVNYTNRTYAAPQPQVAPTPAMASPPPQAPPAMAPPPPPAQVQAAVPPPVPGGGPMNERDLREKEAMQ